MRPLLRVIVGVAAAFAFTPPSATYAHSGTDVDVTSNYRTQLTEVPAEPGLEVEIVDITGTVRVDWRGDGQLTISGYEGEPYLRLSPAGVERNTRSPATFLDQDRYANVAVPASADADAAPDWAFLGSDPVVEWHDHRNHWMSTIPPTPVTNDPDSAHVIYERWEIAISIDGRDTTIAGTLTWVPPPQTVRWLVAAALITLVACLGLFGSSWRTVAALVASIGSIAFVTDTLGYYLSSTDTLSNRLFTMAWPLVTVFASARLWIHARHATPQPTLAMMLAGLVLLLIGGIDRFDVLTNSQVFATGPGWLPRVAVTICLGAGVALMTRFLAFLIPLLRRPVAAPHDHLTPTPTTAEQAPA